MKHDMTLPLTDIWNWEFGSCGESVNRASLSVSELHPAVKQKQDLLAEQ
jgi:hypothetical protein